MPAIDEKYIRSVEAENEKLRTQVEDLQYRIDDLEFAIGSRLDAPICFQLTKREAQMLGVMMTHHDVVTKEMFLTAMYGGMDEPNLKIIDVFICKLRKKLARFGIEISTMWGRGYYLTKEMKAKIRKSNDVGSAIAA
jgi:two-component system cell cycle response regulator CtrA